MKKQEHKTEFIRMRAEGKSLRAIEAELGVSKSTLSEWDKALASEISILRAEALNELYSEYGMAKEARIRRIGDTLRQIDTALAQADLASVPPEKLLDFKLKYQAALRDEYKVMPQVEATGDADQTLDAIRDLYRRTAAGETSSDEAKMELALIDKMITGYCRAQPLDDLLRI